MAGAYQLKQIAVDRIEKQRLDEWLPSQHNSVVKWNLQTRANKY